MLLVPILVNFLPKNYCGSDNTDNDVSNLKGRKVTIKLPEVKCTPELTYWDDGCNCNTCSTSCGCSKSSVPVNSSKDVPSALISQQPGKASKMEVKPHSQGTDDNVLNQPFTPKKEKAEMDPYSDADGGPAPKSDTSLENHKRTDSSPSQKTLPKGTDKGKGKALPSTGTDSSPSQQSEKSVHFNKDEKGAPSDKLPKISSEFENIGSFYNKSDSDPGLATSKSTSGNSGNGVKTPPDIAKQDPGGSKP